MLVLSADSVRTLSDRVQTESADKSLRVSAGVVSLSSARHAAHTGLTCYYGILVLRLVRTLLRAFKAHLVYLRNF